MLERQPPTKVYSEAWAILLVGNVSNKKNGSVLKQKYLSMKSNGCLLLFLYLEFMLQPITSTKYPQDLYSTICESTSTDASFHGIWTNYLGQTCGLAVSKNLAEAEHLFLLYLLLLFKTPVHEMMVDPGPFTHLFKVDMVTPLPELFGSMPWESWSEAQLGLVVEYLRGCQKLAIPHEYRPFLPREVEWDCWKATWIRDCILNTNTIKLSVFLNFYENCHFWKRRLFPTKRRLYPTKRRLYPTRNFHQNSNGAEPISSCLTGCCVAGTTVAMATSLFAHAHVEKTIQKLRSMHA